MLNCPDLWQLVWICCLPSPDPSCPDLPKLVGSPQYARVWDAMQCKQGFDACRGVINIGSPASVLTLANWWMLNRQSLVWSFLLMATCISDSCTAEKKINSSPELVAIDTEKSVLVIKAILQSSRDLATNCFCAWHLRTMPLLRTWWHNELSHQNLSRRYDFAVLSKLIFLVQA